MFRYSEKHDAVLIEGSITALLSVLRHVRFKSFACEGSGDVIASVQPLPAYSGETPQRVGVKIGLALGDNTLQAFPFDISALYAVTVVSPSPASLFSDPGEGGRRRGVPSHSSILTLTFLKEVRTSCLSPSASPEPSCAPHHIQLMSWRFVMGRHTRTHRKK